MRVLIADNDAAVLHLMQEILSGAGHEVFAVQDGVAAWLAIGQQQIDVLLVDWVMPRMDGPELIAKVRATPLYDRLHIIIVSGRGTGDDIADGLEMGADDYVCKPFTIRELRARVDLAERVHRRAATAPDEPAEAPDTAPTVESNIVLPPADIEALDAEVIGQLSAIAVVGGERLIDQVTAVFIMELPRMLDAVQAAVTEGDPTVIRLAAHSVKGSGQGIGATRFVMIARQLEELAYAGQTSGSAELLSELRAEFSRVTQALQEVVGEAA